MIWVLGIGYIAVDCDSFCESVEKANFMNANHLTMLC